jgi:hypothetical protein
LRAAFRKGLGETGYVEGQDVAIECHWLEGPADPATTSVRQLHHVNVALYSRRGTSEQRAYASQTTDGRHL